MADCPFMNPGTPSPNAGRDPVIYCRLPRGRVRVPSRDERARFCLPGRWGECPVYLAASRRVRALTGLL